METRTTKVYAYMRYSTERQEEHEQEVIIGRYCDRYGIRIDETVIDRAVSGSVSWENRNLFDLVSRLQPGDAIICSEASRLSRSMADFSMFMNNVLRKMSARLIVCNMGMDIDCSNLNALTEIQLQMLMFAAQFEREMMIGRIQAAMDYRKDLIAIKGGFVSKSGVWRTTLGNFNPYASKRGGEKTGEMRQRRSLQIEDGIIELILSMRNDGLKYFEIADALNEMGKKTARGGKFYSCTVQRLITAHEKYGKEKETA